MALLDEFLSNNIEENCSSNIEDIVLEAFAHDPATFEVAVKDSQWQIAMA